MEVASDLSEIRKNPSKMSMVINKGHKPSFFKGGSDPGWSPDITMDKSKGWVAYRVAKETRLGVV